jgi:hypothetical protein
MRDRRAGAARGCARICVAAACMALAMQAAVAGASFSSAPSSPSMSVSTGTLAAPTGLGAQNVNCQVATSTKVNLTWTATASTWADGYEVFRSGTSGGPYTSFGTVSGQSTVTYTDSTVTFSTTYYYVVQATKNSWRSPNSNQATITTPTVLCV